MPKKTAGEKIRDVLEASRLTLAMYEAGIRKRYPGAMDREILLRVSALHLSRDLMIRAYGWDPEGHAKPD